MNLTILGASPAFPNPGGATSGYLVRSRDTELLVECGHGVAGKLLAVADIRRLTAIVISHMHPDHFFDLIPLHYAFQFLHPDAAAIPLWLPPGGLEIMEMLLRAVDITEDFLTSRFSAREYEPGKLLRLGELEIRFAPTRHFISGYAMRIERDDHSGSVLGYSSDTGTSETVLQLLGNVQLALIEATVLKNPGEEKDNGHLSAGLAGRLAQDAGVGRLLLTHYSDFNADQILTEASVTFGQPVELAREGETYIV